MIKKFFLFLLILLELNFFLRPSDRAEDVSSSFASTESSIVSPSGRYNLTLIAQTRDEIPDNGVRLYIMSIYDADTDSSQLVQTQYRVRDNVLVMWDDNLDRIWVDSSDTGIFFWDYDATLSCWFEFPFAEQENAKPPKALQGDLVL